MLTKKHIRTVSLSILLAAGLYFIFIFNAETKKILAVMQLLSLMDWLVLLSCAFTSFLFRFIRWNIYIRSFQHFVPLSRHFAYYLAGLALTTTPAKAGETIRSLYLLPHQVKISQSLACFFTERLLDVCIMVFLASFMFFTLPEQNKNYAYFTFAIFAILIILLPLLRTRLLQNLLLYLIKKIKNKYLSQILKHLQSLLISAKKLLAFKMLSLGLVIGLIVWVLNGLVFYLILTKVGFPITLTLALTLYAISILAGAASLLPGGIGATEAVMGLMLLSIGSESHIAIAVPILTRLATLWFAVCIGLLANIYLSFNGTKYNS